MSILLVGKKIVVYDVTTSSIGLVIFQGICAFFFFLRYLKSWKIGGSEGHTFVTWGQGKSVSASLTDLPRALVDDGMKGFSRVSKIALLLLFFWSFLVVCLWRHYHHHHATIPSL